MGQYYSGISDGDLIGSQMKMLKFAGINQNQVSMIDIDINDQLYYLSEEYKQFFYLQQSIQKRLQELQKQQNFESPNKMTDSFCDADQIHQIIKNDKEQDQQQIMAQNEKIKKFDEKADINNVYQKEVLFELPHQENYMHSNSFSTSDLDYVSDLNDPKRKLKPKLLMIHGFGGTGMVFYRMIGHLRKYFRVTTLDLFGMGSSGRPPFKLQTGKDCIQFMIDAIEAYIRTCGFREENEEYYLAGHSLGGYLSTEFALKYPQQIKKLILFSPVGIPQRPKNFDLEKIVANQPTLATKLYYRTMGNLWDYNVSIFAVFRSVGYYGTSYLLNDYVQTGMIVRQQEERFALRDLFQQVVTRKQSSEICCTMILKCGAWARDPLEFRIKNLEMPVCFLYGEWDWMERCHPDRLLKEGHLKEGSSVHTIPQSGHCLFIDNPDDCTKEIINFVFGEEEKNKFLELIDYNPERILQEIKIIQEALDSLNIDQEQKDINYDEIQDKLSQSIGSIIMQQKLNDNKNNI